jgi:hypothetical protein
MKRLILMIIMAVACAGPSFAIVDGELYGGYNLKSQYITNGSTRDMKGPDYGARAHFTTGGILLTTGIGVYYQKTKFKYDLLNTSYDFKKDNFGGDIFARISIIPVFKPYARAGLSAYEKIDYGSGTKIEKKYFNSYYVGVGAGLAAPLPGIDLMLFAEYLYGNRFTGDKIKTNTINGGISVGI